MARYKGETNYYLDKNEFSAARAEALWTKLSNYIDIHKEDFASVSKDYENRSIKLTSTNLDELNELIKFAASDAELDKCLVMTCLLNTKLDKENKCLVLTDENSFDNYNEVIFHITCSEGFNPVNSLFFHDSALEDYTVDDAAPKTKVLAVVSYKEQTIANGSVRRTKNDMVFFYYDTSTNRYVDGSFQVLNNGKTLSSNLSEFISNLNNGSANDMVLAYADFDAVLSNFKIAKTQFKMESEADFLNFASCVPAPIYNDFINNLPFESING